MKPSNDRRRSRAFTLAELLIVLAILALAALVVVPGAARMLGGQERRVRQEVIEIVRAGQIAAAEKGLPVSVVFEPGQRRLSALDRGIVLPSGWWVRRTDEPEPAGGAARDARGRDALGRAFPARVMMTWSPGGLVSECDWLATSESGVRIRVYGNSIDGVRIE